MSAKLFRAGVEQLFAAHSMAPGRMVFHRSKRFDQWPGVYAPERKTARTIILVEWKQSRLPCLSEDWWK